MGVVLIDVNTVDLFAEPFAVDVEKIDVVTFVNDISAVDFGIVITGTEGVDLNTVKFEVSAV